MKEPILNGVCCAFCADFEKKECPVVTASPWSRWSNFCSEYKRDAKDALSLRTAVLVELAKERLSEEKQDG